MRITQESCVLLVFNDMFFTSMVSNGLPVRTSYTPP